MTDVKEKALELVKEVAEHDCYEIDDARFSDVCAALFRAIEQHEAFRQEVSDAVWDYYGGEHIPCTSMFAKFAIPKPDPLVDVFCKGLWSEAGLSISTKEIRAALDALGFEIRSKSDDR